MFKGKSVQIGAGWWRRLSLPQRLHLEGILISPPRFLAQPSLPCTSAAQQRETGSLGLLEGGVQTFSLASDHAHHIPEPLCGEEEVPAPDGSSPGLQTLAELLGTLQR